MIDHNLVALHTVATCKGDSPAFDVSGAANRVFLLNFTVYDPETMTNGLQDFLDGKPVAEDCWAGEQSAVAVQ